MRIRLTFVGGDNKGRPVYKTEDGTLLADATPIKRLLPNMYTKVGNKLNGDIASSLDDKENDYEFFPTRYVWKPGREFSLIPA